ncbi:hypothetical protein GXM_02489 [Nostoc sphaeroides CCNUC1]|uniref:Uncharacterized protein n=1 Tax=Nostoc sphaeroides CCNUC1 TaxID=2653204 RepID=A0A5P8VXB4_9NOSO|nr:hypothetical protein GXM_02489 [Nostoc sphaeroides CCNUC1]
MVLRNSQDSTDMIVTGLFIGCAELKLQPSQECRRFYPTKQVT